MPEEFTLHEADSLALDRVGDDAACAPTSERNGLERLLHFCKIVAVDLPNLPAEGPPLVHERIEIQHLADRSKALDLVVVDDGDEVVQRVVRREQRSLPGRTLVALAVAQKREHAVLPPIPLTRQRHSARD